MDSSIIAALSAILGTTVGGLTSFATTFLNQRYAVRRDILAKDVANREELYSVFLKEVASLYFDSINRTVDDVSQQTSLTKMYSLVGRIRMISSQEVLTAAEKVTEDVIESYKRPPMTFQEQLKLWGPDDPWHEFTKACRAERQNMLGRL
jgi:flagellar hook assembly protein FlgD